MKLLFQTRLPGFAFIISLFFICSCKKNLYTKNAAAVTSEARSSGSKLIDVWLTTADTTNRLKKQSPLTFTAAPGKNPLVINVDGRTTFQTIDGFGFALTGGSAALLNQLGANQSAVLNELFGAGEQQLGISYLRISIGASDLNLYPYTYDEVLPGSTDINLNSFSIEKEKTDLIPVLKKILAINPNIKLLATPWTAPTWMKVNTNNNTGFIGGSLNTLYYDVYAKYFIKYLKAFQAEGITINAIAPQNEPLNGGNNPSMVMQPAEQATFIKSYLGPQLKSAGLQTKIIVYDHNADRIDYAQTIYADKVANSYIDGAAFHLYGGDINALTQLHNAYPKKNLYFTEQYVGGPSNFAGDFNWHTKNLIIGATRNWCKTVLEWNLASDPAYMPHTAGGCTNCEGALTIAGSQVLRNTSYYIIGQASKFVKPGAKRIISNFAGDIQNVAFKNSDGTKVLIVLNTGASTASFDVQFGTQIFSYTLPAGAAATFKWNFTY